MLNCFEADPATGSGCETTKYRIDLKELNHCNDYKKCPSRSIIGITDKYKVFPCFMTF